jgi:hypothetical protein
MRKTSLVTLALSFLVLPPAAAAQDYVQYEVQRVSALPGSTADIGMAILEHNELFHAEAPYAASVHFIVTGEYAGQFEWVMGPTTFAQIDARPADLAHGTDWTNRVLANAEVHENHYWIRVDELSYMPELEGPRPVSVVRRFDVADAQLFAKVQRQINETFAAANAQYPRVMYQRRGASKDPWGWALVFTYPNWAAMDDDSFNFGEEFQARNGAAAWETFLEEFGQAVNDRDDMIRQLITRN